MRTCVIAIAWLLIAQASRAAEPVTGAGGVTDQVIDAYAAYSKATRPKALKDAKYELGVARRKPYQDDPYLTAEVAKWQERVKAIEDKTLPFYAPLPSGISHPKVGEIGFVEDTFEVVRVLNETNAVVRTAHHEKGSNKPGDSTPPVVEYGDDVWMTHIDTTLFVEGKEIDIESVFAIIDERPFATSDAVKNVPGAERVDISSHAAKFVAKKR